MTYEEFLRNGLFDEAVNVHSDRVAPLVLDAIGFPRVARPPLVADPVTYWRDVCGHITGGGLDSGTDFQPLVDALAARFPRNVLFEKFSMRQRRPRGRPVAPLDTVPSASVPLQIGILIDLYVTAEPARRLPLRRDALRTGIKQGTIPSDIGDDVYLHRVTEELERNGRSGALFCLAATHFEPGQTPRELEIQLARLAQQVAGPEAVLGHAWDLLPSSTQSFLRELWHELRQKPRRIHTVETEERVDIVVLTAVPVELEAVLRKLAPPAGSQAVRKVTKGPETYYVGALGDHTVVALMCEMGAGGAGGAILTADSCIRTWRPRAVVMVGVAFGRDASGQALGDVIVATQVIAYEVQRVGEKITVQRGAVVETGLTLRNRFRNVPDGSVVDAWGAPVRMRLGPLLSGDKLVDNAGFKAMLFQTFPQAVGGEMEGIGVYAAAARNRTEWIVVKAICDWGDGTKADGAQPRAADAAASLVGQVLSHPDALDGLP